MSVVNLTEAIFGREQRYHIRLQNNPIRAGSMYRASKEVIFQLLPRGTGI